MWSFWCVHSVVRIILVKIKLLKRTKLWFVFFDHVLYSDLSRETIIKSLILFIKFYLSEMTLETDSLTLTILSDVFSVYCSVDNQFSSFPLALFICCFTPLIVLTFAVIPARERPRFSHAVGLAASKPDRTWSGTSSLFFPPPITISCSCLSPSIPLRHWKQWKEWVCTGIHPVTLSGPTHQRLLRHHHQPLN